jgi:hypothetical protein
MKLTFVAGMCFFAFAFPAFAADAPAPSADDLLDPARPFISDVSGYHGIGSALAPTEEESERLAKSAALDLIFKETNKDDLFRDLFISSWPESIGIEAQRTVKTADQFSSVVRIRVDGNALLLADQPYRTAATNLLDRAEQALGEVDLMLAGAEEAESKSGIPEALTGFRNARSRAKEIRSLIKPLGNPSLTSDNGMTLKTLLVSLDSQEIRISSGLERIQTTEIESEKGSATQELEKAFELLSHEMDRIDGTVGDYERIEPFYDLPRTTLETILLDLSRGQQNAGLVHEKLINLKSRVPADSILMGAKVSLALSDLGTLETKLAKQKTEAETELREPRLARQEAARQMAEIGNSFGTAFGYVFLHVPTEILGFRYTLPFGWDGEHPVTLTKENDFLLRAEGTFPAGFWIRASLSNEDVSLAQAGLAPGSFNSSLSSELAMGYFHGAMFGAGFGWDWIRTIRSDIGGFQPVKTTKEMAARLILGGANQPGTRIDWLLSLRYRIPQFTRDAPIAYLLNASLDWTYRVAQVLLVEAGVSSGCVQTIASPEGEEMNPSDLTYAFRWSVSVALRLPAPFTWGVTYRGMGVAPITDTQALGAFNYAGEWGAFFEYNF